MAHEASDESSGIPSGQGVLASAIEALGRRELRFAAGADGSGRECVEGLSALAASPIIPNWRRCIAGGAGVTVAAGQLGDPEEVTGMFEPAPALHSHINGNQAQPDVLHPDRVGNEL